MIRSIYPFFETIRIEDGVICHLDYHLQRMKYTLLANRGDVSLLQAIKNIKVKEEGGVKRLKIFYDLKGRWKSEIIAYKIRNLKILNPVFIDHNIYPFKYTDRKNIEATSLFIYGGYVAEGGIGHIAYKRENKWYTPEKILLPGTMRRFLLNNNVIEKARLHYSEINEVKKWRLFNAMTGWEQAYEIKIKEKTIYLTS